MASKRQKSTILEQRSIFSELSWFRIILALAVLNPVGLISMHQFSKNLSLTSITLILLILATVLGVGNPVWVSLIFSLENFFYLNYFFIEPIHSLRIHNFNDLITLAVFILISITFSILIRTIATKEKELADLLLRVERIAKRSGRGAPLNLYKLGGWYIDISKKTIGRDRKLADSIHLTPIEWKILALLLQAEGGLVTQQEILRKVWGEKYSSETNYLRLYLSQLRKKLEPHPKRPDLLITERGSGYRANTEMVVD